MQVKRSITVKIRDFVDMEHRWRSSDKGLIWCWERGRQMSEEDPELASRARNGELMVLAWKGGVPPELRAQKRKEHLVILLSGRGSLVKTWTLTQMCQPISFAHRLE